MDTWWTWWDRSYYFFQNGLFREDLFFPPFLFQSRARFVKKDDKFSGCSEFHHPT